jgi:hypothetical protein
MSSFNPATLGVCFPVERVLDKVATITATCELGGVRATSSAARTNHSKLHGTHGRGTTDRPRTGGGRFRTRRRRSSMILYVSRRKMATDSRRLTEFGIHVLLLKSKGGLSQQVARGPRASFIDENEMLQELRVSRPLI